MPKKKDKIEEGIDIEEKIDALHDWERGEGSEPTDFAGDVGEIERRYAQLKGLPVPEEYITQ